VILFKVPQNHKNTKKKHREKLTKTRKKNQQQIEKMRPLLGGGFNCAAKKTFEQSSVKACVTNTFV